MTVKRDFKRRVRERQARTGESYMTALRQVRAQVDEPVDEPRAISVVELVDVSEIAAPLGLKLRVTVAPNLIDQIDVAATLTRFRSLLLSTTRDRQLDLMRDVVLGGARPLATPRREWFDEVRELFDRGRAGLGGVSEGGTLLAMAVDSKSGLVMVLFHLALRVEMLNIQREPMLGLSEIPLGPRHRGWFDWNEFPF